jgi:DNA-binding beta-propeller fold protein YncE
MSTAPTAPIVAGPGANIAWVTSQVASNGAYTDVVRGIDPMGRIVGRINAPIDLRSPDGAQLYALVGDEVRVYSAVDGHIENIFTLPLMSGGIEMLSEDGQYLAVATKTTVQLVDLGTGRLTDPTEFGLPAYGVPVIVGPRAQHVYIVGDTVTRLAFDGARLRVDGHSTGKAISCSGLVVGGPNSAGGLPFRVLADGRTLVSFCPGDGHVTWFDLAGMTVTHETRIPQANPFWVSPVFSADGNTLYLYEGGTGSLHVVDVAHQTVTSTKVAMADTNLLARLGSLLVTPAYAGGIDRTAAVSPDGTWLYVVRDFGGPGGLPIVHLPDLTVKGRWLPDVSVGSPWVSADGNTIYVLSRSGDELRVLRTDGTQVAKMTLLANTYGFIVPTIP